MKKFLYAVLYLFTVYLSAILFFGIFRLGILFQHWEQISGLTDKVSLIMQALWMGIRFDTVISCYLLILPVLFVFLFSLFNRFPSGLLKVFNRFFCIFFSLTLFVSAVNIPYFAAFFKNINASIWNWIDEPAFVVEMVTKEPAIGLYLLLFVLIDVVFCLIPTRSCRFFSRRMESVKEKRSLLPALAGLVLLGLCFVGIRGRLASKSPIRMGTAYFCNNALLNQLGLNPNFVLLNTSLDAKKNKNRELKLMPEEEAIRKVREYLNIVELDPDSPIARKVEPQQAGKKKNIVLILMESMAASHLENSEKNNLPFLQSLIQRSIYFPNFYSAGIHTFNGIYSTLFAYPALLNRHSLKSGEIQNYACLPAVLKENGYKTVYFSTHDDQFDNIGGYLAANQVEKIVAQKDYPEKEVLSNLGVPDDFMFRFSMDILRKIAANPPFLATYLTASNHPPYIVPEYYHPQKEKTEDRILEYSDWALSQFFELAKKESWYENTIFILTGDHGAATDFLYDVSLAFHHIPLLIFDPENEEGKTIENVGCQLDIFPTIMGMLGLQYRNNTFGIDLLHENRPYAFFSSDNSYECIDREWYYVHRNDRRESLYQLADKEGKDRISAYPAIADSMKQYVESMIQAAQYMIRENKQK
jgi:phosphoglycerol transferase MdoB-like AlkP superfamily enzyme